MKYVDVPPSGRGLKAQGVRFRAGNCVDQDREFLIRKACIQDVNEILELLNMIADSHFLLPRGPQYIYENIRDFIVAIDADEEASAQGHEESPSMIAACGSLHVLWEDLAEVRSLAIRPEFQKCGIGRRIVDYMRDEARALGIRRLFAFTMAEEFFRALGFEPQERDELPVKVWGECSWCPKYFKCDEVGMILQI
jgi:amino-acid N-acetyltransferase